VVLSLSQEEGAERPGADWHPRSVGKKCTRGESRGSRINPALPRDGLNSLHLLRPVSDAPLAPSPSDCRGASKARLNRCVTHKAWRQASDRTSASLPRPLLKSDTR